MDGSHHSDQNNKKRNSSTNNIRHGDNFPPPAYAKRPPGAGSNFTIFSDGIPKTKSRKGRLRLTPRRANQNRKGRPSGLQAAGFPKYASFPGLRGICRPCQGEILVKF
jgi:hypothetical protein